MEKFSFFNDINDDRVYYAEDFARHLKKYFTNGIFNNELKVIANNDMTITIQEGDANIEGYRYTNTGDLIKTIETADGTLKRIDNVVVRLDLTNRLISAQIIKGTFSDNPSAPALVRSSTIYDIKLAEIYVGAGATSITQSNITDTRFEESVCGIVASTVKTLNTENVYDQLYTKYNEYITKSNKSFETWFNSIKDQLSSDAAGNLQNQINQINSSIERLNFIETSQDINNLKTTGTYYCNMNTTNVPQNTTVGCIGYLHVFNNPDTQYVTQIFTNSNSGEMYIRHYNPLQENGTVGTEFSWKDWEEIVTKNNALKKEIVYLPFTVKLQKKVGEYYEDVKTYTTEVPVLVQFYKCLNNIYFDIKYLNLNVTSTNDISYEYLGTDTTINVPNSDVSSFTNGWRLNMLVALPNKYKGMYEEKWFEPKSEKYGWVREDKMQLYLVGQTGTIALSLNYFGANTD